MVEYGGESGYDIGMLSMEEDHTPKLLLHEKYDEKLPQISPDGKWLAYQSNESDSWEIYLRPFTDMTSGGWKQVSIEGGEGPGWSPDGDELYYRTPDAIMAVSVETEPTIKLGKPIPLFPNKYVGEFDIHPHTKRFLMLKPHEAADGESTEDISPKIIIITNWFEELKQKLPVK